MAPATAPVCPLCGNARPTVVESVRSDDLARLYRQLLGREVVLRFPVEAIDLVRCTCGLSFYWPAVEPPSGFYEALGRIPWYYQDDKPEFAHARGWVGPGDRVLEIGCGRGAFGHQVSGCEYTGLELNPEAVAAARRAGLDVRAQTVEEHARAAGGRYDVVVGFQVLEHLERPRAWIAAAAACLRPGGVLVLSVPSDDAHLRLGQNNALNLPPHHLTRWTTEAGATVARQLGFALEAVHHEALRDCHVDYYLRTLWGVALARAVGGRRPLVDLSAVAWCGDRLAGLLARLLRPAFEQLQLRPAGQAMTFVFRAPGSAARAAWGASDVPRSP